MLEEKKLRKIAVSQETFDKIDEAFINKLKNDENVVLVIVAHDEILKIYQEKKKGIDIILLGEEEKQELIDQNILEEKIYKMPDIPPIFDMVDIFPKEKQKTKYYVPHTIGKPNSKKKGGR